MLHQTVLLREAVDALAIKPAGTYIDGTLGRAGHSKAILEQLGPEGRLICFDQDHEAIEYAQAHIGQDPRVQLIHTNFEDMLDVIERQGLSGQIDGVLLDLGICSTHVDDASRGFSFRFDAPLDMRMDLRQSTTAATLVNTLPERELADVLYQYGEERKSRRIAKVICERRKQQPIETTKALVDIILSVKPMRAQQRTHPATQSFQALRIAVNRELDVLKDVLTGIIDHLSSKGRLAVISFHSLEDRIVKQLFKQYSSIDIPPQIPIKCDKLKTALHLVGKAIRPTEFEVRDNPRARSAIMRVAEKNEA